MSVSGCGFRNSHLSAWAQGFRKNDPAAFDPPIHEGHGMKPLRKLSAVLLLAAMLGCEAPPAHARDRSLPQCGLGTLLHPLQKPEAISRPGQVPCCHKEHVYIFAVNGLDPMCLGNLNGICNYLIEEGFANTYFSKLTTWAPFAQTIRQIRQDDPNARIVVIGFSYGCNCARSLVDRLAEDDTRVDLLVYLAGDMIDNSKRSFPANVCRVLNIRARGFLLSGGDLIVNGADIDGARNCKLDVRHMLLPSRKETLELLMNELLALACGPCPAQPAPLRRQ
jgi:hypothetical protein